MAGSVEITQYMRPNGRRVEQLLEVDSPTLANCLLIKEMGYWFECEVLMTGAVSMTITDDKADHAISSAENKPGEFERAFSAMAAKFSNNLQKEAH